MPRGSEEAPCVEVHNLTPGITLGKLARSIHVDQTGTLSDYFQAPCRLNIIAATPGQHRPQGVQ